MKKIILFCLILGFIFNINAQEIDFNLQEQKCSKSYSKDFTPYYNSLLDNYDINFVFIDIEISETSVYVSGNTELYATVKANELDTLILELIDEMTIDSIVLDGSNISFLHSNDEISVPIEPALAYGENFNVIVYYHGNSVGGGVITEYSDDWGVNCTWTLSETWHASEWWPCKQVMSDKIDSAQIFLTVPSSCKAGSNGLLTHVTSMGGGKDRYEWKTNYPIAYYLISFAVANYQEYNIYANPNGHDPILIQNYIYDSPGCMEYYNNSSSIDKIDNIIDFMEVFVDVLDFYPFENEKYGHCLTEMGGAMEHQTMTSTGHFSYLTIAHELAHQWFGDYVTCASWQDIWINEGITSYFEYIALENLASEQDMLNWLFYAKERALREPEGSIYIPFEEVSDESRIFSYNLSYRKGALFMHMIRHEINNDELFIEVLKTYLNEFKDSVATGDDFLNVLNDVSLEDHSDFFNSWYYRKGYPEFTVTWLQNSDTVEIHSIQQGSSIENPFFTMHVDYKIVTSEGDTTIRVYHDEEVENYKVKVSRTVTNIVLDPDHWILHANSQITKVNNLLKEETKVYLYPNPSNEYINLEFSESFQGKVNLSIIDVKGSIVYQKEVNNDRIIVVPTSELSKGLFILKIKYDNKLIVRRFIKN